MKKIIAIIFLLSTSFCASAVTIKDTVGTPGSNASSFDIYMASCEKNAKLFAWVRDEAPIKTPTLRIHITRGSLFQTNLTSAISIDKVDGDGYFSKPVTMTLIKEYLKNFGFITIFKNKDTDVGAENYTLVAQCYGPNNVKLATKIQRIANN